MRIVYDDGAITLCEKPIGVSSEATDESENMPSRLLSYYEEKGERKTPYVLHRLDMAVGGLMVFAKTKSAAAKLSAAISEGKLEKEYLLVVAGDASQALGDEGELFDYLFKDSKKNKSFAVKKQRRGVKEARLTYRVLGKTEYEGNVLTLLSATLITGRTHQIRVQFSSRGFPLFGDGKYGSRLKGDIALFSRALRFEHPVSGEALAFSLPAPDRLPFSLWKENLS